MQSILVYMMNLNLKFLEGWLLGNDRLFTTEPIYVLINSYNYFNFDHEIIAIGSVALSSCFIIQSQ